MLLSTISEPNSVSAGGGAVIAAEPYWNAGSILICTIGLSILVLWLFWFDGFAALRKAPVRRNRMSPFIPMMVLGVWILLMFGINWGIETVFRESSGVFRQAVNYPAMVILEVGLILVMLFLAHRTFARGIKGFGLDLRTVGKDAGAAVINLAAVYALVIMLLWVVLAVGTLIDPDFSLEQHQSLTFLGEAESFWFQLLTVAFAVVIVPIFEEMLFRGLLQTSVRSLTASPWTAILLTSLFFSILHPPTHAPALFALSCGLGYAYERSGSLLRSILMHIFFNGLSVGVTLLNSLL